MNSDFLSGRVALVTGGGTGIGRSISLALSRAGARICVLSRDPEHHKDLVHEVDAWHGEAHSIQADVRSPESIESSVKEVLDRWGRIDILINNAAGNFLCPANRLSPNGWRAVVDIVLNGTFLCSQAVLPTMKSQKGGCIVNIGATYAWLAAPLVSHSGAAKAGVLNLTRSLAVEWGRYGVRVNAVTPGPIEDTEGVRRLVTGPEARDQIIEQTPLGRFGRGEDVANAVLFLVSPQASFVTGHNLVVDGGLWLGSSTPFRPAD